MNEVDPSSLVPAAQLEGDDAEDTRLLRAMYAEAESYLLRQTWCSSIRESYFGVGVGGVVAAFLFRIVPDADADEYLWVVVGDLPTAYLVTDRVEQPVDPIVIYCEMMHGWVDAVRLGTATDDAFPVDAPQDEVHADLLAQRVRMLSEEVVPKLRSRSAKARKRSSPRER